MHDSKNRESFINVAHKQVHCVSGYISGNNDFLNFHM